MADGNPPNTDEATTSSTDEEATTSQETTSLLGYGRAMQAINNGQLDVLCDWIKDAKPSQTELDDLMAQAVSEEQVNMFAGLLDAGASPIKFVELKGLLPIVLKKDRGKPEVLKLILDNVKPRKRKEFVNRKDRRGNVPVYVAAKNGHAECVKMLLECGANVNKTSGYDGYTPLNVAAEKGFMDIVQMLIDGGANVHKTTMLGDTALCWAAKSAQVGCIRVLLQAGANVNAGSKCGETPLMAAVKARHKDSLLAVKEMLAAGADITKIDWRKQTVLWYAANYSTEEMAMFLAEQLYEAGQTNMDLSMLAAVERDHVELVQLLLSQGWTLDCKDRYDRGVLHIAAERGVVRCLKLLLDSNRMSLKDVNDCAGRFLPLSPLDLAIRWCHPSCVAPLLESGAETNRQDKQGSTPLIACIFTSELRSRATMAKLILQHGCDVDRKVMPKVVKSWGIEEFDTAVIENMKTSLTWAILLRELWFAKMLWIAGARPNDDIASWTDATFPKPERYTYPQDEYTPAATKKDMLHFIETVVCQPRTLAQCCRITIRRQVPRPISQSIQQLPLPSHINHLLNLPELEECEAVNLQQDQQIIDNLASESDEDYDSDCTSTGSEDSVLHDDIL